MIEKPIHVYSEILPLEVVLLHRPGRELLHLVPDYLDRMLFEDIPYLLEAQKEHDAFADLLRSHDVEVVYLEDLVSEVLQDETVKKQFVSDFIDEAGDLSPTRKEQVRQFLSAITDPKELVLATMAGITKSDLPVIADKDRSLCDIVETDYPFVTDPMPNLYFTRDAFSCIGNSVSLHRMHTTIRNRETIYGRYIFTHHPIYGKGVVPFVYTPDEPTSLEGGDELVLSDKVLLCGISERTQAASITRLMMRLVEAKELFETIIALSFGQSRKFMHLDTVLTQVDRHHFLIHEEVLSDMRVLVVTCQNESLRVVEDKRSLEEILAEYLGVSHITFIPCGGEDSITAQREQWNDAANVLAISPGTLIAYDRNTETNRLLEEAGMTVMTFKGSELVRGRGGARCMSMPLRRKGDSL